MPWLVFSYLREASQSLQPLPSHEYGLLHLHDPSFPLLDSQAKLAINGLHLIDDVHLTNGMLPTFQYI